MPMFAGLFLDKVGLRIGFILFSSILTVGWLITTIGVSVKSFPLMLIGTLIFGTGESTVVAQHSILTRWFRDQGFGFVMGLNLSISKLGGGLCAFLSPKIVNQTGEIKSAYLMGFLVLMLSMTSNLLMVILDKKADKVDQQYKIEEDEED